MERLRQLTAPRRFGLVLLGALVGNIERTQLDPLPGSVLLVLGGALCLVALGLLELAVHVWHSIGQRSATD